MERHALGLWPHELSWKTFSVALARARQQWLVTFIEYADRFGQLPFLADYIAANMAVYGQDPRPDVRRVVTRFRERIAAALAGRFPDPPVPRQLLRSG
jgi:hypothetical protein